MYLALGTVVVGGSLCYFEYTRLGDVERRVSKLRTEVSDPKAVKTRLDQSSMKLEGAQQSLMHLEANVSSAAYVPSLLRDLDGYGKQNGIAVTGVRPAPKKPGDDEAKSKNQKPYDELSIQVTGQGDFDSIENFVANLPKFPKIVAARMISIEPARTSGPEKKTGLLNMTVELKAYVFKADAPATTTATTSGPGTPVPNTAITGAGAPATASATTSATGSAPSTGGPSKPGSPAPAELPKTSASPVANSPAPTAKTAPGKGQEGAR
jgi:Tfp pilus assembly protein PilO